MTSNSDHWDGVYASKEPRALTWHEDRPQKAVEIIREHTPPGGRIIDVGGGASRLVDALLGEGLGPVTVLDLSARALAHARSRLGDAASKVDWQVGDITAWRPDRAYAFWHDRAVFHFLTDPGARAAYVGAMNAALSPGAVAMIATFADDGPEKCSGLPVCRYAPHELAAELERLAPGVFEPVGAWRHVHVTPANNTQNFQTSLFRKGGAGGQIAPKG